LSFLRFTPTEYRLLCSACVRFDLAVDGLSNFRRLLVLALGEESPNLARRIEKLRLREVELLYYHFRPRPEAAVRHDLTDEELSLFAEVCTSASLPVRFVRPFQKTLVESLTGWQPELATKVDRLSGYAFERLYNQAVGRECWGA
jgi:hypothetical protein